MSNQPLDTSPTNATMATDDSILIILLAVKIRICPAQLIPDRAFLCYNQMKGE